MKSLKVKIVLAGLRGLAHLPLWVLHIFSNVLYFCLYYVVKYRRTVVRRNLHNALGEDGGYDLLQVEREFYYHLCDCIFEFIKLLHISDEELNLRVRVNNGKLVEQLAKDGRSVIMLLGHYGNWEWMPKATWHFRQPGRYILVYRPAKNRVFDEVMRTVRARFNFEQVPQKQIVRRILRHHTSGEQFLAALVADQRPNSMNLHNWTTFLNQETPYTVGGEEIGKHIDAHYVYAEVQKPRRGYYDLTFKEIKPVDGEKYPYTMGYLRMMEETIKRDPTYWLWSHDRWKFKQNKN